MMRNSFFLTFILLLISLPNNAQSINNNNSSELNKPGNNMWISWVEDFGYSWRVNPQGLTGNPFQYIQNLYPIDSSAVNDYILGKSGHSMYIFTFDTKLRIQTYDGSKKEIIHTEYCSYKRRPSIDPIYWIDFPEYKFILRLDKSHDYTTKLILSMEGIPSFKSDEKEHTWMTSVNSDIMSCGNGSVDFNLRPYTENGMKEMVEDMWMNIRAGSEEEKMIQLLTFGDSLRVQTYNVLQRKVVRTATYKYERIKKRIYSMRVFLPDGKAILAGSPIYSAYLQSSLRCE